MQLNDRPMLLTTVPVYLAFTSVFLSLCLWLTCYPAARAQGLESVAPSADEAASRVLAALAPLNLTQKGTGLVLNRCCHNNSEVFLVESSEQLKALILPYTVERDESLDPKSCCMVLPEHHYELEAGLTLFRYLDAPPGYPPVNLEICGIHDLLVTTGDAESTTLANRSESLFSDTESTPEPGTDFIDAHLRPEGFPEPEQMTSIRFFPSSSKLPLRQFLQNYMGHFNIRLTGLVMDSSHPDVPSGLNVHASKLDMYFGYIKTQKVAVSGTWFSARLRHSVLDTDCAVYNGYIGNFEAAECTFYTSGTECQPKAIIRKTLCGDNFLHLSNSRLIGSYHQIKAAILPIIDTCYSDPESKALPSLTIHSVQFFGGEVPVSLFFNNNPLASNPQFVEFENSTNNHWYLPAGEFASRGCSGSNRFRGQIEFQKGIVCKPEPAKVSASTDSANCSGYITKPDLREIILGTHFLYPAKLITKPAHNCSRQ